MKLSLIIITSYKRRRKNEVENKTWKTKQEKEAKIFKVAAYLRGQICVCFQAVKVHLCIVVVLQMLCVSLDTERHYVNY